MYTDMWADPTALLTKALCTMYSSISQADSPHPEQTLLINFERASRLRPDVSAAETSRGKDCFEIDLVFDAVDWCFVGAT